MSRSKRKSHSIHLGVNIDHVATLRQVRQAKEPDLIQAAKDAERGGADSITVHLREDRRHIQDADLPGLLKALKVPLNLEMALSEEILAIALHLKPAKVCLVPEKRRELTTEGGLDVVTHQAPLKHAILQLQCYGIEVSLFIDPEPDQVHTSAAVGAQAIEIHTGSYANASGARKVRELSKIRKAARLGAKLGLKIHAGHGLNYENVQDIIKIPEIVELNIGHSIVSRAMFDGIYRSVAAMRKILP